LINGCDQQHMMQPHNDMEGVTSKRTDVLAG
jgi:hypothetical protein